MNDHKKELERFEDIRKQRYKELDKPLYARLIGAVRGFKTSEYALLIGVIGISTVFLIAWLCLHISQLFKMINGSI